VHLLRLSPATSQTNSILLLDVVVSGCNVKTSISWGGLQGVEMTSSPSPRPISSDISPKHKRVKWVTGWATFILALLTVVVVIVGVSAFVPTLRVQEVQAEAIRQLQSQPVRIVYWRDPQLADRSELASALQTRAAYVTPDFTAASLAQVEASTPLDGIVVDASLGDRVDWAWMQDQYRQGVAIVGFGTTVADLSKRLDVPVPSAFDVNDPNSANTWSLLQVSIVGSDPKVIEAFVTSYLAAPGQRAQLEDPSFFPGFEDSGLTLSYSRITLRFSDASAADTASMVVANITAGRDWKLDNSVSPSDTLSP
jgi:hypothetical protein